MPTAAYTAQVDAFGRRVQWLVEIDLDRCSLLYGTSGGGGCGVAADLGDGARCYYTWQTCQNPSAYTKTTRTWRFCLNDVPWPDNANPALPYLARIVPIPQTVDPDKLTIFPAAVTVEFLLDYRPLPPDPDKGASRYNSGTSGEFWRNLLARNRNYANRPVRILRGFFTSSFGLSDFVQIGPTYKIKQITVSGTRVQMKCASAWADLSKQTAPWTISSSNVLKADIDAAATSFDVKDGSQFPNPTAITRSSVYVQVEAEVMKLTTLSTNTMTVTRGQLGTSAAAHKAGKAVQHVLALGTSAVPRTATDAMLDLLEWASVPAADINTATFDAVRDGYWSSPDIAAFIRKPMRVTELITRLREPRNIIVYMDDAGKFCAGVIGPPATSTASLTDDNLVEGSVSVVEDMDARITRVAFWFDPDEDGGGANNTLTERYSRGIIVIDASLEQSSNYGDKRSEVITDALLDPAIPIGRALNIARRMTTRKGNGIRWIEFEVDLKNGSLAIGDTVSITTRHILGATGSPLARSFFIVEREDSSPSTVKYRAIDLNVSGRFLRIMGDGATDSYDSASQSEKDTGGYWGNATTNTVGSANETGYVFW
jgi:hypothetical protein